MKKSKSERERRGVDYSYNLGKINLNIHLGYRVLYSLVAILIFAIVGVGFFASAVLVDTTKPWHFSSEVRLKISGVVTDLQSKIIDRGLMNLPIISESFVPSSGHNASEIWLSVRDGVTKSSNGIRKEMTLQTALAKSNLCGMESSSVPATVSSYSGTPPKKYMPATQIQVFVGAQQKSLLDAINFGEVLYTTFSSKCIAGRYRDTSDSCNRDNTLDCGVDSTSAWSSWRCSSDYLKSIQSRTVYDKGCSTSTNDCFEASSTEYNTYPCLLQKCLTAGTCSTSSTSTSTTMGVSGFTTITGAHGKDDPGGNGHDHDNVLAGRYYWRETHSYNFPTTGIIPAGITQLEIRILDYDITDSGSVNFDGLKRIAVYDKDSENIPDPLYSAPDEISGNALCVSDELDPDRWGNVQIGLDGRNQPIYKYTRISVDDDFSCVITFSPALRNSIPLNQLRISVQDKREQRQTDAGIEFSGIYYRASTAAAGPPPPNDVYGGWTTVSSPPHASITSSYDTCHANLNSIYTCPNGIAKSCKDVNGYDNNPSEAEEWNSKWSEQSVICKA